MATAVVVVGDFLFDGFDALGGCHIARFTNPPGSALT
jgi:hypothetical protein